MNGDQRSGAASGRLDPNVLARLHVLGAMMAIPKRDYLLSVAVNHDLVTVKETRSRNRILLVDSENKVSFFQPRWH